VDFARSVVRSECDSGRILEDRANPARSSSTAKAVDLAASIECDFRALVEILGRAAVSYGATAEGVQARVALAAATQGLVLAGRLVNATDEAGS
jgi:hypothetical protein